MGPPRTNISWQKKTKDARGRRLRPFRQNFFGTSSENIALKKIVGQPLCIIRVYSLLVQNFYSFSKLPILQYLSQSSYSNNCKNPVIHTSEYVGSTKIQRKNFLKRRNAVLRYLNVTKKQNEKRSLPTKDMLLWSYYAYSNCKKKNFHQRNFWFHEKSQKLCFSEVFYLKIIFFHIFPMFGVPRKAGIGGIILGRGVREFWNGDIQEGRRKPSASPASRLCT